MRELELHPANHLLMHDSFCYQRSGTISHGDASIEQKTKKRVSSFSCPVACIAALLSFVCLICRTWKFLVVQHWISWMITCIIYDFHVCKHSTKQCNVCQNSVNCLWVCQGDGWSDDLSMCIVLIQDYVYRCQHYDVFDQIKSIMLSQFRWFSMLAITVFNASMVQFRNLPRSQ